MDLSIYKLNCITELDEMIAVSPSRFCSFQEKVYSILDRLPEGACIYVSDIVKEKSYKAFIKLACAYILEKRANGNLGDSFVEPKEDYTKFRRVPHFEIHIHPLKNKGDIS
mgnify:CR=1 FL=1